VESNRELLRELLVKADLQVVEATNGNDALRLAQEYGANVIIMDIRMPGMDGVEAARHLRSNTQTADIPIIALTAYGKNDDIVDWQQAGFVAHLTKPVRAGSLFHELSKILEVAPTQGKPESEKSYLSSVSNGAGSERYDALRLALDREILPACNQLQEGMRMNAVRELGNRLDELGRLYGSPLMCRDARQLNAYAESYEFNQIRAMLTKIIAMKEEQDGMPGEAS
jgi:CheY-like chemotaxis protein